MDLHAAARAGRAEAQCQHEPIAFLVNVLDVDPELVPRLVHPAPELSEPLAAAVHGVEIRPNARGMELDVGVEHFEPGVPVVVTPGLVALANQFGVLRHGRSQPSRWLRTLRDWSGDGGNRTRVRDRVKGSFYKLSRRLNLAFRRPRRRARPEGQLPESPRGGGSGPPRASPFLKPEPLPTGRGR